MDTETIEFRVYKDLTMNFFYIHFIPLKKYILNTEKYSVILYLFDAASRYVFKRQMTKTIEILRKISKTYKVYEMLRFHAAGPKSIHNYLPLFYGVNDTSKEHKIIFQDFKEKGYVTITLIADCHNRTEMYGNTSFNGTDHNIILGCKFNDTFLYGSKPRCVGNTQFHKLYIDFLDKASKYYNEKSIPFFSYISFMEAHEKEHISLPRVDIDFSRHLLHLMKNHILDNTILIMLSDHGINYSRYFHTKVYIFCKYR